MSFGATMELGGKEVGLLEEEDPLLLWGDQSNRYPTSQPADGGTPLKGAVLPHLAAGLPLGPTIVALELCTEGGKKGQGGGGPRAVLVMEVERYYRLGAILPRLLPLLLPPNPTREATLAPHKPHFRDNGKL